VGLQMGAAKIWSESRKNCVIREMDLVARPAIAARGRHAMHRLTEVNLRRFDDPRKALLLRSARHLTT
jgi:hypothetical protein